MMESCCYHNFWSEGLDCPCGLKKGNMHPFCLECRAVLNNEEERLNIRTLIGHFRKPEKLAEDLAAQDLMKMF